MGPVDQDAPNLICQTWPDNPAENSTWTLAFPSYKGQMPSEADGPIKILYLLF